MSNSYCADGLPVGIDREMREKILELRAAEEDSEE